MPKIYKKRLFLKLCQPHNQKTFCTIALLSVVVATFLIAYLIFGHYTGEDRSLRFLCILHRHGERTPTFSFPTNPYNESFWPEGIGALTKKGIAQLFASGQLLRERYKTFIPREFKSDLLYAYSSHVDRSILSIEALLAGLFPPVGNQIWNPDLLWQPIPVHPIPSELDDMICMEKECPPYEKERDRILRSYTRKVFDENAETIDYIAKQTGRNYTKLYELSSLYDTLLLTEEKGLQLPDWTKTVYPEKLFNLTKLSFSVETLSLTLKRFKNGVLINDVLNNMKKKMEDEETFNRKLALYSVHDLNLVSLWRALNVIQEVPLPGFGATMIFELHEKNNLYRVKILYKNRATDTHFSVLSTKGCENDMQYFHDQMCSLNILTFILDSVTIKNFDKECKNS